MTSRLYITYSPRLRFEPETISFLETIEVPEDGTVYYSGTAYEITGDEIWDIVDEFVRGVKELFEIPLGSANLVTKFKFIYPRIGGTATAHKYNLVDVGTFEGIYSGGWTHDGSGALPNGTNAYMDTQCAATEFTKNDLSFGFDSKTNTDGTYADFGALDGSLGEVNMYSRTGAGNLTTRLSDHGTNSSITNANSLGIHSMSRQSGTSYKAHKEGAVMATHSTSSVGGAMTGNSIYEAATNNAGSIIQYSPRKRTLFYGGMGMSDVEVAGFHTLWRTLDTALGR